MRIRLEGTEAEISAVIDRLTPVLTLQEVSRFYPNRGASVLGRVYLTVGSEPGPVNAASTRADRPRELEGRP